MQSLFADEGVPRGPASLPAASPEKESASIAAQDRAQREAFMARVAVFAAQIFECQVQLLVDMATDEERAAHLRGIAKHNGEPLASRLRREAWSRMKRVALEIPPMEGLEQADLL